MILESFFLLISFYCKKIIENQINIYILEINEVRYTFFNNAYTLLAKLESPTVPYAIIIHTKFKTISEFT
jgi:hypothetical protein